MTSTRTYMLDTNVISHMMRDPTGLVAQRILGIEELEGNSTVCTNLVVQCELLFGLHKRPNPKWERQYHRAMASITVEPLDQAVAAHYATVRAFLESRGQPIGPNDTLIAAHALALDATLVTADAEFTRVPGLKTENWLQPK